MGLTGELGMNWAWTFRKTAISVFVSIHMAATLVWVIPDCPVRRAAFGVARLYIVPLGLWQYWGMFAPDPLQNTVALEAEVVDAQGLRHHFDFPRTRSSTVFGGILNARHSKFAMNLNAGDLEHSKRPTARYAVRKLDLPAKAYPLDAYLLHNVKPAPALGEAANDGIVASQPVVIGVARFETFEEVNR